MNEPPVEPRSSSEPADHLGQTGTSGAPLGPLGNLRRRIYLTYRYHGLGSVAFRAATFPLRFTPLVRFVTPASGMRARQSAALAWFRRHGKPVAVVIPSYRDAAEVARLVRSIRRTTPRRRVRIIVADDASGPEQVEALRRIRGIEVVAGEQNLGFAGNVNRGLAVAGTEHDVVLLNSDMIARRGWLAALQLASRHDRVGIVGAKLLYGDGRIQFAGTVRNPGAPEWFDHRYRFKPANWGPANVTQPMLAVTGACMYLRRDLLEALGGFDEAYPMAYEDVDYCLRAWQAGYQVIYCPEAELAHFESITRGSHVGERERESQRVFWERWGDFFDAREVRDPDRVLRVIYVTQDTGVGGGHRVVFEHANRLLDRGYGVEVWSLTGPPDWFELRAPVRTFRKYRELIEALKPIDAIKVATWWETADPVWEGSIAHGIPVYFVQDIETSYYPDSEALRHRVLASYRHEFHYLTTSEWNADRLRELGLAPTIVPPGIDLGQFRPLPDVPRGSDMLLALGRSNPLKNLPLTLAAWRALPEPRPELCLFGVEPWLAPDDPKVRYVAAPSDEEVNQLLNEATAFVQTSVHEGFCLPVLEAMATGCPVVCTDAHGNRDYCENGLNCLMPQPEARAVASALQRALSDPSLRNQLGDAGRRAASAYSWPGQIDALERFFDEVSRPRRIAASTDAVPDLRRGPAR
jgi:GT2 family glycosyltransferase/glycosyltransferase involved in cell wall biosynthesis